MSKEKIELSFVEKIRARLNENSGKELVKTYGEGDSLLQVKSWIPLKPFFKMATGGDGFPCGHVSMLIGAPDSGKSTLAMEGIVSCQKLGGAVFLIDSEHKFSMGRLALMGGKPKEVLVTSTNTLEEAWDSIEKILQEVQTLRDDGFKNPIMVVWDSVAASVPESMLLGEAGDSHFALEAKLNNKNIRRLRQSIEKTEVAMVLINHYYFTTPKTKYEQPILVVKGGEELSFMSTLIIRTKQGAKIERTVLGEKQQIGRVTRFMVHKGHFHGRTISKDVNVVDVGILETAEDLAEYQKSLRGEY
jgi:RecA/RadA recombinase